MESVAPQDIIVIDEAGADLRMDSEYARAEGGKRATSARPFARGNKFSIIGALSVLGIIAVMYVEMSVNTDIFLAFITTMLVPKLRRGMYVILDNVGFHKSEEITRIIESVGARVVFLPPYSPDLSPIEKMWSKIKEILRKLKPRSKAEFHDSIGDALNSVEYSDCEEWFECCGYNV